MKLEDDKLLKKMLEDVNILRKTEFNTYVSVDLEWNTVIIHAQPDKHTDVIEFNVYTSGGCERIFCLKFQLCRNPDDEKYVNTKVIMKESIFRTSIDGFTVENEFNIRTLFDNVSTILKRSSVTLSNTQLRLIHYNYLESVRWYIQELLNLNKETKNEEILELIDKQIKELENLKNKIKK